MSFRIVHWEVVVNQSGVCSQILMNAFWWPSIQGTFWITWETWRMRGLLEYSSGSSGSWRLNSCRWNTKETNRWHPRLDILIWNFRFQIDEWSPTLRWHNSSVFGPPGHTVKCIIDPKKVLAMWTHRPSMLFPGFHVHELKPEEGIVRHYRDLQMWNWGKTWLKEIVAMGPMSMTDYPARYQKNLTDAVKKRTKYVYEKYNPRLEKK